MVPKKFLMCKPDFFNVEYSINPWMKRGIRVDRKKVQSEWTGLVNALEGHGCRVETIDGAPNLPDMVFAADAGFVQGKTFLLANFHYEQRKPESRHYARWFFDRGYKVAEMPKDIFFEGKGDLLNAGKNLYFGYGFRSSPEAAQVIKKTFPQLEMKLSMQLADQKFFHLNTCFSPIDESTVLYFPKAFKEYCCDELQEYKWNTIEVPEAEAAKFVCNNITIGKKVIAPICENSQTYKKLQDLGFEVIQLNMSEFLKSGGAVRCLALEI